MKIAVARPTTPFVFVESWTISPSETQSIREQLTKLPNVRVLPNQEDLEPRAPNAVQGEVLKKTGS